MSMATVKRKAKVVMLPTKKAENSLLMYNDKSLILQFRPNGFYTQEYLRSINADSYHLHITSDEEIKEGNYVIRGNGRYGPRKVLRVKNDNLLCTDEFDGRYVKSEFNVKDCKKIVATTDKSLKIIIPRHNDFDSEWSLPQPSRQFIDVFIGAHNTKNPIEDVLVDYEEIEYGHVDDYSKPHGFKLQLKVDKANYITITKVKDSWSKEEVKKLINLYATTFVDGNIDQWIDKNSIFLL